MSARKTISTLYIMAFCCYLSPVFAASDLTAPDSLARDTLAKRLGWVQSPINNCGGYYLEAPFIYPISVDKTNYIETTSNQTLFSLHGTSILEGRVTVYRSGQQLTANKAYLYRDPNTGKLNAMDVIGNVHLREPNTLVVGKTGRYNFNTKSKSLLDILYRTSMTGRKVTGAKVPAEEQQKERKITGVTAWGKASEFTQTVPKVYEFRQASFSTCPPIRPAWRLKASHIVLNKNIGRGYATNARLLVKNVPIFYTPYISFPLDRQRKSGFLWPTYGGSNRSGPTVYAPYYWNMAPNYDMTITPGILMKRGIQVSDNFRYLTTTSHGNVYLSVLPHDRLFSEFQSEAKADPLLVSPATQPQDVTDAEINRLLNASTTRKGLVWHDDSFYNTHWSSHVDFSYVGDDYYLRDFGNISEATQNELLQEGDIYYKGANWNFTGRLQAYQTMHPVDEPLVLNQYRRFPQLILNADYPDQWLGMQYFINNEVTHFDIRNTPGTPANQPIGNRLHTQPGISWPLLWRSIYITPRFQVALTDYNLYQTKDTGAPTNKKRAVPIFDLLSGIVLDRNLHIFGYDYQQTLEPQLYYTYIPFVDQSEIPVFDTTVNTLTYDELFNYNRFSGIDRIGDANQLGVGLVSRFIDQDSGLEKVRLAAGGIVYFADRRVTLCNSPLVCSDNPLNPNNRQRLSPVTTLLDYKVNPLWSFSAYSIWNTASKQLDNGTVELHYIPDPTRVVNLGYSYVHGGDILSGFVDPEDPSNNLKVTDFSFAWPLIADISVVGRWSQNWNHAHLQNLLYGLQYDTCCWGVRMVGGRAFTNIDTANNNKPVYDSQFYIQFSLKGLGEVGQDPSGLLRTVRGYKSQFGQEL